MGQEAATRPAGIREFDSHVIDLLPGTQTDSIEV